MSFERHLDACQQCRDQPFNPCDEGAAILKHEVFSIPPEMAAQAHSSARMGKALSLRWMQTITEEEANEPAIVVHALAFLFAGMLTAMDDESTVYENMGLGLISDQQRLALFMAEVNGMAKMMRETKVAEQMGKPSKGVM